MGYFQVMYDSRVVSYNRRASIRLATGFDTLNTNVLSCYSEKCMRPGKAQALN